MRAGNALSVLTPILCSPALFTIRDTYIGRDFLGGFNWETLDDPTHGRVNYTDQATALQTNLSFASDTKFIMRADDTNVVLPGARGRGSIRITSHKTHADSIIVLDLAHMPEGCSTWPAFWTLSKDGPWPQGGEIDIIEGVNLNGQNLASLHTTPDCKMSPLRLQKGEATSNDCNTAVNSNQGCGTSFQSHMSYGTSFNEGDGGWFVMQRTEQCGINVWFWSRNDPSVPPSVRCGEDKIVPDAQWGLPESQFQTGTECDYDSHFNAHQIIFDLTFCGDWAGSVYSQTCPGSCVDFVNNNPQKFSEAYWEINSLRVYTP